MSHTQTATTRATMDTALKKRSSSPQSQPTVQFLILRLVYQGTLLAMPLAKVREFWKKHPPSEFTGDTDLFQALFEGNHSVDLEYLAGTLSDLEEALAEEGTKINDFLHQYVLRIYGGTIVPAKLLLSWAKPVLGLLFSSQDIRLLILRFLNFGTKRLADSIVHTAVRHKEDGEWWKSTVYLMNSYPIKSFKLHKSTYRSDLPPFDAETWTAMIVQHLPVRFNLPPYEKLAILCDFRSMEHVVPNRTIDVVDGKVSLDGKFVGVTVSFNDFCAGNNLKFDGAKLPDREVVVMNEDYHCPNRDRIVLHKGAAYGCPVFAYQLKFRKIAQQNNEVLSGLIDEITNEGGEFAEILTKKHKALVDSLAETTKIEYYIKEESISVNGKHIVKFVPAKILRKMLKSHMKTGQTLFEYREFIRDDSIIPDPISPNLTIRLQRLMQTLESEVPQLKITKSGRGALTLECKSRIEYEEIE